MEFSKFSLTNSLSRYIIKPSKETTEKLDQQFQNKTETGRYIPKK
jgi:hypothetical protein